ncbi:MAG: LacI family transcriptional regulator [Clostridiales bacterium]|nr:LacI family transcriptional regulator [Clostridiales bacterium]
MNIYDISKQANVSIATVSRVLNGSTKVRPATRKKVLDVIQSNNYTPNAFARSLGLNSMQTAGIMCADSSDIYLAQAIYYLERELRQNSYTSMLCCTGYQLEKRQHYLQLLLSRNVDAIFFVGSNFIEEIEEHNNYLYYAAQKVPVFILNGHLSGKNIYSILCDDYATSFDLTEHILHTGSRHPLYFHRTLSYSGKGKREGFRDAYLKHGITDNHIYSCTGNLDEAKQLLTYLNQEKHIAFDSIITSDDELAIAAVKYALAHHRAIPDDIQIAGYNNSLLSRCCTPELTTADNRVEFMCVTAVSLMMQLFKGKEIPSKTTFSGNIVPRQTTKFQK